MSFTDVTCDGTNPLHGPPTVNGNHLHWGVECHPPKITGSRVLISIEDLPSWDSREQSTRDFLP